MKSASSIIKKSNNWDEFKFNLNDLSNKEKGDAFELLVKLYLKTNHKYKSILKNVWLKESETPQKILDYLNLTSTDRGIDLIAETVEGEFWAIQAKYRSNEGKRLTHRELSTFMTQTFAVGDNIAFGLLWREVARP